MYFAKTWAKKIHTNCTDVFFFAFFIHSLLLFHMSYFYIYIRVSVVHIYYYGKIMSGLLIFVFFLSFTRILYRNIWTSVNNDIISATNVPLWYPCLCIHATGTAAVHVNYYYGWKWKGTHTHKHTHEKDFRFCKKCHTYMVNFRRLIQLFECHLFREYGPLWDTCA